LSFDFYMIEAKPRRDSGDIGDIGGSELSGLIR
jgi:hypothetical protein